MVMPCVPLFRPAVLAASLFAAFAASAQQSVPPPTLQLWMDVSTGNMAGMPEMQMPPGMGPAPTYGMARGVNVMPPRVLDIALYNRLRPGAEASQAIPPGVRLGPSLPLLPPQQAAPREREPGEMPDDMRRDMPKGRILIYWGCGETVRRGQPTVIDLARANPADLGVAMSGRYAADRGARVSPRYLIYPNERSRSTLPRDSSLVGEHRIAGDGVPASMRFTLGEAQNLMPAIDLRSRGGLADSIALSWPGLPQALGYYLHAMGQVGNDMVIWSSAETGDTGMGLLDFLPNAMIERWVRESVLLNASATACSVPKGIFAAPDATSRRGAGSGAMLRMIAYGAESNFVHPPRPTDPRALWEPEWAVRVRVKSNTMAQLGEEPRGQSAAAAARPAAAEPPPPQQPPVSPAQSALESVLPPNAAGVLRGLFGR
jgi:hypothetical protein